MDEANPNSDSFERLQKGDPQAAAKLFARYSQRLTRLAEQHLSQRVASRVDGEDVVQSAFRTFFRRSAQGEFKIDSANHIWRLLVRITLLKARAKARHHTAAMRDVRAETAGSGEAWRHEIAARQPGPEEAAMLLDEVELLLQGLPPLFANVLQQRLQGYRISEISSQLGISRQSIYEVLKQLQQRIEKNAAG
jgi:RNA polymerase sigma-70 factor (ECF subfamily)